MLNIAMVEEFHPGAQRSNEMMNEASRFKELESRTVMTSWNCPDGSRWSCLYGVWDNG